MRIAGIIAEYNPFHNGHAYHIRRTREITGCDYVVVCMDGHFTQRGEAACMSKWDRARMALACGADAVFELPALFAVRTADAFARGGVDVLGGLGADYLSFGSETEDVSLLNALACIRDEEPNQVSAKIRENLDAGMSHAKARGLAVGEHLNIDPESLNRPNMILGAEYIRFIERDYPDMKPVPVLRRGDYHDESLGEFASASAIRGAFARGDGEKAMLSIPEKARAIAVPDKMHAMDDLLLYKLRNMSCGEMGRLPDCSEGLESRLFRLSRECTSREHLLESMKCRRYTHARLSRLLAHAMLDMTDDFVKSHPVPEYARLIGMRSEAGPLLKELSDRSRMPVVSSSGELKGDSVFELECRATDIWALLHDEAEKRLPGREFTEKFVRI